MWIDPQKPFAATWPANAAPEGPRNEPRREAAFDDLARLAAMVCRVPTAHISLISDEWQWFKGSYGGDLQVCPRSLSLCAQVLAHKGLLVLEDLDQSAYATHPVRTLAPGRRSYAGVPLLDSKGRQIGALCVSDFCPRAFTPDELEGLRIVARQAETQFALKDALSEQQGLFLAAASASDRLEAVIEAQPECVKLVSTTGTVMQMNRAGLRLLGASAADVIGHSVFDFVASHDKERFRSFHREVCEGTGLRLDFDIVTPLGGRHMETHAVPFLDRQTGETMHLAVTRDVTAERDSKARIEEAGRLVALGTMAAGVAHELNNPLAYVVSNIAFALSMLGGGKSDPLSNADAVEALTDALDGAGRMRKIVKDLSTFSRAPTDQAAATNVNDCVEASCAMAAHQFRDHVGLKVSLGKTSPVFVDQGRLTQVIVNLLINALQAMPANRPSGGSVEVSTEQTGDEVIVSVADNGSGMSAEVMAKVFQPFFTTKAVGVGTGLGLSVCYSLVAQMKGRIVVASEVTVGSRFQIILPAAPSIDE